MIRLLGAITGSALALAALLVLVGVPRFKAEPKEIERAVVTLPLRFDPVIAEVLADEVEIDQAAPAASEPVIEPASEGPIDAPIEGGAIETLVDALQPDSPQWYAFWSPFRSEIAASGFVTQLQRVTGLDYRVVKVKPGVYEVAFAYLEDGDISLNLSQISAATGLDMPGT